MNLPGRFKKAHDVVADVANRAANEMWNVSGGDELKPRKIFLKLGQRIAIAILAVEKDDWIETDERKPPGLFVAFGGFKKKTRLSIVDLGEGRDWRLHIGHKFDNHGDKIAAFDEGTELV